MSWLVLPLALRGLLLPMVLMLTACQPAPPQTRIQGKTMGTYYVVKFYSEQQPDLTALQQELDTELELINDLMSTYRPESELMRFNRQQTTEPVTLTPQTATVIAEAIRIGQHRIGLLVAVKRADRLAKTGPDTVVVDARRHHQNQHLQWLKLKLKKRRRRLQK